MVKKRTSKKVGLLKVKTGIKAGVGKLKATDTVTYEGCTFRIIEDGDQVWMNANDIAQCESW
jgi:hypothetical protein